MARVGPAVAAHAHGAAYAAVEGAPLFRSFLKPSGWSVQYPQREPSVITFTELHRSHVLMLAQWLSCGEALRWYAQGRVPTEEELASKYLNPDRANRTKHFVSSLDGVPVGFLQYYRIAAYPEYADRIQAGPGDYGIDLFIGVPDAIGRGVGTMIVKTALASLVFTNADAARCVLGPSPENLRAIRCFEKCGFRHTRTVEVGGVLEYVMVVERVAALAP
jgi:RimJ/RimL family protein N-acetyltransferase